MKKIIMLNGSFCEEPIIKKAKEMGFYVITTGNDPRLQGHRYSDKYIEADYSDKELILKIAQENEVDGILSCANDFGVLTAAYVAEKMKLRGHDSLKTAETIHLKDKFKKFTRENHIPSPVSEVFNNFDLAMEYVKNEVEYPIIVKANDLTGGKGINRANNPEEAVKALKVAFEMSRDKHIVIEPFIQGEQQTFVAFLADKRIISSVSCNCFSPINPYLIQYETFPACNIEKHKPELDDIVLKMAVKLNLCDGIIALQYIVRDEKIYVIESMRRPFGNQFLTLADRVSGFDWEQAQILAELGLGGYPKVEKPQDVFCGHFGVMSRKNGLLKKYELPAEIEKHIFMKIPMLGIGDEITNHLSQRVEYIYYSYGSLEEMNSELSTFNDRITVEVI